MSARQLSYGLLLSAMLLPQFALGGAPEQGGHLCTQQEFDAVGPDLPVERQLRRLSLDLRGVVPAVEDYEALGSGDEIPEALLDQYLASEELRIQLRRYHEGLLWTNPSVQISEVGFGLTTVTVDGEKLHGVTSTTKRKAFRGGDGTHMCQNKPQAQLGYDASGLPIAEPAGSDAVGPYFQEGYIEVLPYWESDPAKTIKVCAFDAQTTTNYEVVSGADAGTYSCDTLAAASAKECGCGESLNYCMLSSAVTTPVLSSMREQLLRLIDDHTVLGKPYSEILTTKMKWTNGPLSHFLRYLAPRQTYARTQNWLAPNDSSNPDIPFTDRDHWEETERSELHAGLLTLPAFLLRFQTNRGRANRFRIAFEGKFYQPPSTLDDQCAPEGDDLTGRCVCRGCHVSLEPLSAYFGQFAEAGSSSLETLAREYPTADACRKAIAPASMTYCDRFYEPVPDEVDPDIRPYKLKALRWAGEDEIHTDIEPNFDSGPAAWAQKIIDDGSFHRVAVNQLFEFLMKRPPDLDLASPTYEGEELALIAEAFQEHDDIRKAVREIVLLPAYRRAR